MNNGEIGNDFNFQVTRALKLVSDPPRFSCGVTGEELKVKMLLAITMMKIMMMTMIKMKTMTMTIIMISYEIMTRCQE